MEFIETLTPDQHKLFAIVKDYLNKNPFFTIDDLHRLCKKNTRMPDIEIHSILTRFITKKIIIDGSKLTRDTVLKSPIRTEIYNFISKNPALNFTQLLKKFNLGSYAARWHLEMLRRFGFIRQKKLKIYNVYFSYDFPENKEVIVYLLRNQNVLKIYLCLKYTPLNSNNLAQILNLNYSTIQYHIKDLVENRLIAPNGSNKFLVNPEFADFLTRFYDLNVPQELMDICDDISTGKEKISPQTDLGFRENIKNQLETLTNQIKRLQDNLVSPQSFIQSIEKIENRLLTIEKEMKNLAEILSKLKGIIE